MMMNPEAFLGPQEPLVPEEAPDDFDLQDDEVDAER